MSWQGWVTLTAIVLSAVAVVMVLGWLLIGYIVEVLH